MREHRELIDGHMFSWDTLTVRVEACEQSRGITNAVTVLKENIVGLGNDVEELKSIDLSMLLDTVKMLEIPREDVPASSEIPLTTLTVDVDREDATVESEAEIDEEELGVRDAAMYDDLEDLEGSMVQTAVEP
ncbi:hypothetical protein MTR67_039435 [Solanum verrucosum]|uniref:Polyprotein protein n=1 Tax=Solanum verrucosum TaxID=315347 RepID=A0AAF0UHX8_SOLVR|nr:uncharacterized protein LOC125840613 [Solanum verrucosum]WMV46050.1 hypothetical protein MTR67_039435 [Solanum verrucosum]